MKLAKLNGGPEIFYTIQGEGSSMGKPAIFVRLSGCNLFCGWCDTPYTWNWIGTKFQHEDGVKYDRKAEQVILSPQEVAQAIRDIGPCRRVVFTGGEPLMQQKEIVEVIRALHAMRESIFDIYTIEVETNGTIKPSGDMAYLVHQFNVSPKLENSGNPAKLREKEAALKQLAISANGGNGIFKFVVSDDEGRDLAEINSLVRKYAINPDRVYVMPEGREREVVERRAVTLVEACKELGYNFSTRLHVLVWGAKKGV